MYLLVIGGGTYGKPLATKAIESGHDVSIVEQKEELSQNLAEEIDARVINGDATNPEIIDEAGIEKCDALITTIKDDSVNVLVSLLSEDYNVTNVISVSTTPKYDEILNRIGVDKVIRPKDLVSEEMMRYISHPNMDGFLQIDDENRVAVFNVSEESDVAGIKVSQIDNTSLPEGILLVSISRNGDTIIPSGDTVIESGDDIAILFNESDTDKIESSIS